MNLLMIAHLLVVTSNEVLQQFAIKLSSRPAQQHHASIGTNRLSLEEPAEIVLKPTEVLTLSLRWGLLNFEGDMMRENGRFYEGFLARHQDLRAELSQSDNTPPSHNNASGSGEKHLTEGPP